MGFVKVTGLGVSQFVDENEEELLNDLKKAGCKVQRYAHGKKAGEPVYYAPEAMNLNKGIAGVAYQPKTSVLEDM